MFVRTGYLTSPQHCGISFEMSLPVRTYILATIYSLNLLLFLPLAKAEYKRLTLQKDLLYAGLSAINPLYLLADLQENTSAACALDCLMHSPECAAFLYSARLNSCKLLLCQLNEKLVNDSAMENDWGYWEVQEGRDVCFFHLASK